MQDLNLFLETKFLNNDSAIAKDIQLNFKKYVVAKNLNEGEIYLILYSLSIPLNIVTLTELAKENLSKNSYTDLQIKEAKEISGFMGMLNTYYKFKSLVVNSADYNVAGLRMNGMAKTNLSQAEFEILALVHSLINGCEFCVKAHEQELRKLGFSVDKIHDAVRLASILKAISQV